MQNFCGFSCIFPGKIVFLQQKYVLWYVEFELWQK